MFRKLSCVAAVAGLALVIAAPATGRVPADGGGLAVSRAQANTFPPDAIERAIAAQRPVTERAIDDHFRYDPAELPKPVPVTTSSGSDVEWPQIGIGLGIGVLLMLGVGLVLRFARARPLAH
jgi:hypothetical protein